MKNSIFRPIAVVFVFCLYASLSVSAQDFQSSFNLGPGGTINISNVSGDITITGYNGNEVVVTGFKEGEDRDQVTIQDTSSGNSVNVRARYPENCRRCNASVRFEVKVPSEISYRFNSISSVSGDVSAGNIMGDITIKSVSGDVTANGVSGKTQILSVSGDVRVGAVNGTVSAKSTSGDVQVEISRLAGAEGMEFASVSGDVHLKLPSNIGANVSVSTLSGELKTDFPLNIEESRHGPGRKASGQLGSGERTLKISTVSGDIHMLRN